MRETKTIAAKNIVIGDYIYNSHSYHTDKWDKVKDVCKSDSGIYIVVTTIFNLEFWFHPEVGVAIQKRPQLFPWDEKVFPAG
jgi:hypothetical protein